MLVKWGPVCQDVRPPINPSSIHPSIQFIHNSIEPSYSVQTVVVPIKTGCAKDWISDSACRTTSVSHFAINILFCLDASTPGLSDMNPSLFGRDYGMHHPMIIVAGKQNKQYSTHPLDNFALFYRIPSVHHPTFAFPLQPKTATQPRVHEMKYPRHCRCDFQSQHVEYQHSHWHGGPDPFARHQQSIDHDGSVDGPNQVTIFDFLHGEMELYALRNLILYILVNANEKLNAWSGNFILYHITEIVLGYIIWIFLGGYLMQTLHSSSIKETHLQGDHGPWWRHQIEIYSASLALCGRNPPVTIGFPSQRPATRIFKVFFFDLRRSIRSSKQPRR